MTDIYADTFYWVALLNRRDPYHARASTVARSLGQARVITTEEVLLELLAYVSRVDPQVRNGAAAFVRELLHLWEVEVVPQSHASFLAGLAFYEARGDKQYSGVDCISMALMRERGITDVLTHDHHFTQEGFTVLL